MESPSKRDHTSANPSQMPVLFVGHGSPMNAIEENAYATAWRVMGEQLPRPKAILSISAHWYVHGTSVHGGEHPRTIYDFWGFPEELYRQTYPCPGSPTYARMTQETLSKKKVGWDLDWGLDHGTWIVTKRMFPDADIPVFQLSIDYSKPAQFHYDLGRQLRDLRSRGVLILASGNIVHNLGLVQFEETAKPFEWALEFDARARELITASDHKKLIDYESLGPAARFAVPTPDHYLPLLYALGAQSPEDELNYFSSGVEFGSVSMTAFRLG